MIDNFKDSDYRASSDDDYDDDGTSDKAGDSGNTKFRNRGRKLAAPSRREKVLERDLARAKKESVKSKRREESSVTDAASVIGYCREGLRDYFEKPNLATCACLFDVRFYEFPFDIDGKVKE